jgi:hypothetical protein
MLRELLVTGAAFGLGYVIGSYKMFRAAVADYAENDEQKLNEAAQKLYPSEEEGAAVASKDIVRKAQRKLEEDSQQEDSSAEGSDGRGFQ